MTGSEAHDAAFGLPRLPCYSRPLNGSAIVNL
jgi:hypothetical protein